MERKGVNKYVPYVAVSDFNEGMEWPEDRILPKFALPAEVLDSVVVSDLTEAEKTMFSVLQGIVNAKKPRIYLYGNREEGLTTWSNILGLKTYDYSVQRKYELVKKYADEVTGVILYDPKISLHYINLACTVAGLKKALPVDKKTYASLKENGIDLPVVEDLTELKLFTAIQIYNYMYENIGLTAQRELFAA